MSQSRQAADEISRKYDELAVLAKNNSRHFEALLSEMEMELAPIVGKYVKRWNVDREEVKQWLRLEIWHSVKKYQPEKMPFLGYARMIAENHIKSLIRREVYSYKRILNREALRTGTETEVEPLIERVPDRQTVEDRYMRKTLLNILTERLNSLDLTQLERQCMYLFYYRGCTYAEIRVILNIPSQKPIDNALRRVKTKIRRQSESFQGLYEELRSIPV